MDRLHSCAITLASAFVAVAVVASAVAAPLLVYSAALATFGTAHVLSELRYVDHRFGRSLGTRRIIAIGLLLACAAGIRAAGVFRLLGPATAIVMELTFVVALALAAVGGGAATRWLAMAVAAALGSATLISPFDTVIALSILHNLTPLAFLWDISPDGRRAGIMGMAIVVFVGLPLLVATGIPRRLLDALGWTAPVVDPMGAGPLRDHLYVYVPEPFLHGASAVNLFSAAVVAQCAHYAAVIVVLPAMLALHDPDAHGVIRWPRGLWFAALVTSLSLISLARFTASFSDARALYGIAASLHAWIEIPLIVIALTRKHSDRDHQAHQH